MYEPRTPPQDPKQLGLFLIDELREISRQFSGVEDILLQEMHVEPAKPQDGMIVLADGSDWDPGSGAGFYGHSAGSWVLLG